nr:IS6 family transposase [Rubrimonas cliftonensis]
MAARAWSGLKNRVSLRSSSRILPAINFHAVWLYLRFSPSLRAVEEMLLARGVEVSYETLRRWIIKFGFVIARGLRRRQDRPGLVWHLDEVHVAIRGRRFWLWRAVDENGVVLEEILQSRRDRKAAKRLVRKRLKAACAALKRIVADRLGSYAAAKREIAPPKFDNKFAKRLKLRTRVWPFCHNR